MDITTLSQLRQEGGLTLEDAGLVVQVRRDWIVPAEARVSYTTVIRLIECCREHHWLRDVVSVLEAGASIDSVTKTLAAEFVRPIPATSVLRIRYEIAEVRTRGYSLSFRVEDEATGQLYALATMISVLWDSLLTLPVAMPATVDAQLRSLLSDGHRRRNDG